MALKIALLKCCRGWAVLPVIIIVVVVVVVVVAAVTVAIITITRND